MAEGFAAFAAVAGVADLTLKVVKSLKDDIQAIRDAPSSIQTLKQDLEAMASVLQNLAMNATGATEHLSTDT
jgi:hypothetical protein